MHPQDGWKPLWKPEPTRTGGSPCGSPNLPGHSISHRLIWVWLMWYTRAAMLHAWHAPPKLEFWRRVGPQSKNRSPVPIRGCGASTLDVMIKNMLHGSDRVTDGVSHNHILPVVANTHGSAISCMRWMRVNDRLQRRQMECHTTISTEYRTVYGFDGTSRCDLEICYGFLGSKPQIACVRAHLHVRAG